MEVRQLHIQPEIIHGPILRIINNRRYGSKAATYTT